MASSRPSQHTQDYSARIRYSNVLPQPPVPPKLLHIPGTGLEGGEYTSAGYASRLAREQPLNIEADAELGMPLDLIGIPGVFDGDDGAIMAMDPPMPVHARDRSLLRPLAALGKSNAGNAGVSFLRRTEYISNDLSRKQDSGNAKDMLRIRQNDAKRKRLQNGNKEDPLNILRHVIKGFDIAHPQDAYTGTDTEHIIKGAEATLSDKQAWAKPVNPNNTKLTLLDSYPVLPDLEALPSVGSYIVMKFDAKSLGTTKTYDDRLDVAILQPRGAYQDQHEDRMAAFERDLDLVAPTLEYDYEYYMTDTVDAVRGIKRKLDCQDTDNGNEELYTSVDDEGVRSFQYDRIRTYETYAQSGDASNVYGDSVALALHDQEDSKRDLPKGAYYYPVLQRTSLRPKRKAPGQPVEQSELADQLRIQVRDAEQDELDLRAGARAKLDTAMLGNGADGAHEVGTSQEVAVEA